MVVFRPLAASRVAPARKAVPHRCGTAFRRKFIALRRPCLFLGYEVEVNGHRVLSHQHAAHDRNYGAAVGGLVDDERTFGFHHVAGNFAADRHRHRERHAMQRKRAFQSAAERAAGTDFHAGSVAFESNRRILRRLQNVAVSDQIHAPRRAGIQIVFDHAAERIGLHSHRHRRRLIRRRKRHAAGVCARLQLARVAQSRKFAVGLGPHGERALRRDDLVSRARCLSLVQPAGQSDCRHNGALGHPTAFSLNHCFLLKIFDVPLAHRLVKSHAATPENVARSKRSQGPKLRLHLKFFGVVNHFGTLGQRFVGFRHRDAGAISVVRRAGQLDFFRVADRTEEVFEVQQMRRLVNGDIRNFLAGGVFAARTQRGAGIDQNADLDRKLQAISSYQYESLWEPIELTNKKKQQLSNYRLNAPFQTKDSELEDASKPSRRALPGNNVKTLAPWEHGTLDTLIKYLYCLMITVNLSLYKISITFYCT